jgi:hypothetical protein
MSQTPVIGVALVAASLVLGGPALAEQHAAIISVAGCANITGLSQGYALVNQTFELSNGVENDGENTAIVLCDAELPSDATAFDYAELEYTPGGPDLSPWLVVLWVWRLTAVDGTVESWVQAVGQCGQAPPTTYAWVGPVLPTQDPTMAENICQTQGDLDLTSIEAETPGAEGSLVYLVVLPASSSGFGGYGTGWAQAFRIVQYYEQ